MPVQRQDTMQGLGQSLVLLGVIVLALNVMSTFRAVGFTARFLRTFFVTYGPDGHQNLWLWVYVWAPIVLLPLGAILWALGSRRQRAAARRMRLEGDPMGAGFVGQSPGDPGYDPRFGIAAQASYGAMPERGTDPQHRGADYGQQYGEPYNTGVDDSGDARR